MNSLPNQILRDALGLLPQVDVFRLLRVSRRIERFLRPQLATLALDDLELVLQFRERNLGLLQFNKVAAQIVENYGKWCEKLKVCLPWRNNVERNATTLSDLFDTITRHCSKLQELHLKRFIFCRFEYDVGDFSSTSLLRLASLNVLQARLEYTENDQFESIVDRILQMDENSCVHLENLRLMEAVIRRGQPFAAVKGMNFKKGFIDYASIFPSLKSILYVPFPGLNSDILPASLKHLDLRMELSKDTLTNNDFNTLKALVELKRIELIFFKHREGLTFDFLGCFAKLESISVHFSCAFDAAAFSKIPKSALRCINFKNCPVVCKATFDCVIERNYQLNSISIDDKRALPHVELVSLAEMLSNSSHCLKMLRLVIQSDGIPSLLLDRMEDALVLGLTWFFFYFGPSTTGIIRFLERRKQLIQTAKRRQLELCNMEHEGLYGVMNQEGVSMVQSEALPRERVPVRQNAEICGELLVPKSLLRIVKIIGAEFEATHAQLLCDAMVHYE